MAFTTASQLTSYDNAGHVEMYSYTPSGGELVCDSCNPTGQPATADVHAAQDGLFMTNDGRTFFSTTESLVPTDTNEAVDVYEHLAGRPQLISPGTGSGQVGCKTVICNTTLSIAALDEVPGLVGVSADGTDVYFSTFDKLTSDDHNGAFFKFYDARTNGGFAQPAPVPPCAAAEECREPGSSGGKLAKREVGATLTGGNVAQHKRSRHRAVRHHRARRKHRHFRSHRRSESSGTRRHRSGK
jgi:hypothetical protein